MDVRSTLGAIFVGCLASVGLSCIAMVQFVMYLGTYPQDSQQIKMMVVLVWILDAIHTSLVCTASWDYVVLNFGRPDIADYIPTSVACTVALTAIITFVVHIFFSSRVFRLSKGNWYLTCPLVLLAFMRLAAAFVSTVKMAHIKSFGGFTVQIGVLGADPRPVALLGHRHPHRVLHVPLPPGQPHGLQKAGLYDATFRSFDPRLRSGRLDGSMDRVINTIMIYTLNTGALTCVAAIASMICVRRSRSLFSASARAVPRSCIEGSRTNVRNVSPRPLARSLHPRTVPRTRADPPIPPRPVYANSLLASLNSRRSISENPQLMPDCIHSTPGALTNSFSMHRRGSRMTTKPGLDDEDAEKTTKLEINVVRTVEFDIDRGERAQTPGLA
ncbi:hypothetical protein HETIRDRAFT_104338 [Heterobasidion irregulare TC 32-1]|uniref:Uncharacterized protein n=1 Tax=Heterobasidion irregulare (strain TC 32-1) TaxID=747525 RepID=W4JZL5_HETIT|nr:uncharacterized protein HETIRDRAFT_104338 [Heterobasidion irregulare TC 32-1]ETW79023.1 hypothetical protein HETIRDRAFT_104338 [Heterobasidion irregulare TC 32-1]